MCGKTQGGVYGGGDAGAQLLREFDGSALLPRYTPRCPCQHNNNNNNGETTCMPREGQPVCTREGQPACTRDSCRVITSHKGGLEGTCKLALGVLVRGRTPAVLEFDLHGHMDLNGDCRSSDDGALIAVLPSSSKGLSRMYYPRWNPEWNPEWNISFRETVPVETPPPADGGCCSWIANGALRSEDPGRSYSLGAIVSARNKACLNSGSIQGSDGP